MREADHKLHGDIWILWRAHSQCHRAHRRSLTWERLRPASDKWLFLTLSGTTIIRHPYRVEEHPSPPQNNPFLSLSTCDSHTLWLTGSSLTVSVFTRAVQDNAGFVLFSVWCQGRHEPGKCNPFCCVFSLFFFFKPGLFLKPLWLSESPDTKVVLN